MGNEILSDNGLTDTLETLDFQQERLPKDTSILTTGIIALPFSFGLIGIILSIITLANASSSLRTYRVEPNKYLESSLKKVKSGKVCAIVSLSLFGATILVILALAAAGEL